MRLIRALEAARGESRQVALRCDTEQGSYRMAQPRQPQGKIREIWGDARDEGCHACPPIHKSEAVVAQGTALSLVIVGEKFSLVGGEVDIDGALGFAGLARKAEVERFVNSLALPVAIENIAFEHLP